MFRIHNTTIFAGSQAIYLKKTQGELKIFNGSRYLFSEKITFYFIDSIDILYVSCRIFYVIFKPLFDFVTFNNALSAILYDNSNIRPCISIRLLPACIFFWNLCVLFPEKNYKPAFPSLLTGKDRLAFCSHSSKRITFILFHLFIIYDLSEIWFQRSAAYKAAVDIRLCEQFRCCSCIY